MPGGKGRLSGATPGSEQHISYEVWGKVQHVFMRKYTKLQAEKLGIRGFVENTKDGTVRGEAVGNEDAIAKFKIWLEHEGAPKAKPKRATFTDPVHVAKDATPKPFPSGFEVRKTLLPNGKQWA